MEKYIDDVVELLENMLSKHGNSGKFKWQPDDPRITVYDFEIGELTISVRGSDEYFDLFILSNYITIEDFFEYYRGDSGGIHKAVSDIETLLMERGLIK